MAQKTAVLTWMRNAAPNYVDRMTGEVNATGLAESAANNFNLYENRTDYPIPEWVFDLAAEVAIEFEDT